MTNGPEQTGNSRNEKGKFIPGVSGNPIGRPKGSLSVTQKIKQKLEEIPDGKKETYLELMVQQILDKAVDGDYHTFRQIWEHIDGRPRESVDVRSETKHTSLVELIRSVSDRDN